MRIRNKLAGIAAGAVAISGIAAVALPTPAIAYGPTNTAMNCWIHFYDASASGDPGNEKATDISSVPTVWPNGTAGHVDNGASMTVSGGPLLVGTPFTVTTGFLQGPKNGPVLLSGTQTQIRYRIDYPGAQPDQVVDGSPQNSLSVPASGWRPSFSNTDIITPTGTGASTISVESVYFLETWLGFPVVTACNAQTGSAPTTPSPAPPISHPSCGCRWSPAGHC